MSFNTIVPARSSDAVRNPNRALLRGGRLPSAMVSPTMTASPIMRQFGTLTRVR